MTMLTAFLLVVRVFDRSGQTLPDRVGAIRAADAILQHADISATWVDCSRGTPSARSAACATPLTTNEVVLRITDGPKVPASTRERPLGYSLVEPDAGRGTLGTVFSDRVRWLAKASHSPQPSLLGRAMAHEIGHLLIGTNEHSRTGLMRAAWTAADLRQNRPEDWLFTNDDRERLRNSRFGDAGTRVATGAPAAPDGTL